MKNEEVYFLISEGEIAMIISEISEVLEDLKEVLRKKKLVLGAKEEGSIKFDSDFLISKHRQNIF